MNPEEFQIDDGHQPFLKLHGSSNWRDSDGGELLVIGHHKSETIRSTAVLGWYFKKFREDLSGPDTRLFVIGYGFRDEHINEPIIDAVQHRGLKFFVIDPFGSDVVRKVNSSFDGAIYHSSALDNAFTQGLIGASQRSLSETFGNDSVSYENVMRFFF